jgi:hypothetical protein
MKTISRQGENGKQFFLILLNDQEVFVERPEILNSMEVDGIIRIHKAEYNIPKNQKYLSHFNLQVSNHKPSHRYALPKIIRPGYFNTDTGAGKLPLLDFKDCRIGECTESEGYVGYSELEKNHTKYFEHSFSHIQNTKDLKESIWNRYSKSMPNLTKAEIYEMGVAWTLLRLTR